MKHEDIIKLMSLEEKASLTSGKDFCVLMKQRHTQFPILAVVRVIVAAIGVDRGLLQGDSGVDFVDDSHEVLRDQRFGVDDFEQTVLYHRHVEPERRSPSESGVALDGNVKGF